METTRGHWFGLPPIDEDTTTWGARAISTGGGGIDILHDRQSWQGDIEDRKALSAKLNAGPLGDAINQWRELMSQGEVSDAEPELVTIYFADGLVIEANTNGSYGYVYLRAYEEKGD